MESLAVFFLVAPLGSKFASLFMNQTEGRKFLCGADNPFEAA